MWDYHKTANALYRCGTGASFRWLKLLPPLMGPLQRPTPAYALDNLKTVNRDSHRRSRKRAINLNRPINACLAKKTGSDLALVQLTRGFGGPTIHVRHVSLNQIINQSAEINCPIKFICYKNRANFGQNLVPLYLSQNSAPDWTRTLHSLVTQFNFTRPFLTLFECFLRLCQSIRRPMSALINSLRVHNVARMRGGRFSVAENSIRPTILSARPHMFESGPSEDAIVGV